MEGSDSDSEIKVFQGLEYGESGHKNPAQNTLSVISNMSKEMDGANDSSLDCLAKELFREDSNSNNQELNENKQLGFLNKDPNESLDFDSGEEGVVLGELPECSGLVDFIDKTLTLSNQNLIQALSCTYDKKNEGEKYSITFHDLLEGFKYDCHTITEQLAGVKKTMSTYSFFPRYTALRKLSWQIYSKWY